MKGQGEIQEKQQNEVEIAKTQKKKNQNDDSEDDPGSQKQNRKDARNVYQRPRRTKEQTIRDEQYTRRNQ